MPKRKPPRYPHLIKPNRTATSIRLHPFTIELLDLLEDKTGKNRTWLLEEALWQSVQGKLFLKPRAERLEIIQKLMKKVDKLMKRKKIDPVFLNEIGFYKQTAFKGVRIIDEE